MKSAYNLIISVIKLGESTKKKTKNETEVEQSIALAPCFAASKKRTFSTVTTHNAVAMPLEASIQHHKTTPPLQSSFDVLEHLVSSYRDSRCLKDAKLFHLRTLKLGFHYDTFLCNTLVNAYVRAGDLVLANKLFDEMPDRNSYSWAALISGYIQNGMFSDGCGMFREMVCSGSFPDH